MIKWNAVEYLLSRSSKDEKELKEINERLIYIDSNWNEFTEVEYYDIMRELGDSMLDPISNGMSYNQTDILKHLKKLR